MVCNARNYDFVYQTKNLTTIGPFFFAGGFFGGDFLGFLETRAFSAFFGVLTANFR